MKYVGQTLTLKAVKLMPQGMYLLTDEEEEILLPNKYIPTDLDEGGMVEVFIYTDSEDRPIATTVSPKIKLNKFAFLKAVDVNNYGAFFEWGIEKDLLVPFSEQYTEIRAGKKYLIYLYKDDLTDRLVGTTKYGRYIKQNKIKLNQGNKVDLIVSGETEVGFTVIVNHQHYGMIYKNEIFKTVNIGDNLIGYVQRIRTDNKLDITLNSSNLSSVETLANEIYERLLKNNGTINVSDKSNPAAIYREFHVSKKSFRRAVGLLYSGRKITINPTTITLIKEN